MKFGKYKMLRHLRRGVNRFVNFPDVNARVFLKGKNVIIESGVKIYCDRLILGDGVIIKSGTQIMMKNLIIGDYTTIYDNCFFSGTSLCQIGHNCWFGHNTIVDSIGSTYIGNNVGVGAHSQLWTHAYFGDTLEGCRFASEKPLLIDDDVWFVGHCIVSPIHAMRRSMAMVGSVITKDMEENHVYAGAPAKDMTDRFGPQFKELNLKEKREMMQNYYNEFLNEYRPKENRIEIVDQLDLNKKHISQFSLSERVYIKNLYPEEVHFMNFLLPTKAKFLPVAETDWISHHLSSTSVDNTP